MTDKTQLLPHQVPGKDGKVGRDAPWIFRTYAGYSSPRASNALYRSNLSKGQTGLSIAFDLATQCGYDSDDRIARPELGKVGVPINSLDDFHVLFEDIPLEQMNTSMTIKRSYLQSAPRASRPPRPRLPAGSATSSHRAARASANAERARVLDSRHDARETHCRDL